MKARILFAMLAGMACAAAAAEDERARFLREMARTDGNPQGDHAIPVPTAKDFAKLTREPVAFFRELARTDGNAAPEPVPQPEEAVATH
jgi:hypothetical protein